MSRRFFETSNGIKGGMLKGKPHYDSEGNSLGGIKAIVTDQGGTPVELEGNEVIINKKTVQSDKVLTVKGTPKEILSTLNQMEGNGVAIGDEEAEILAKYREGGELIKRADGSYSRRGLWDNIRDNIGSGRKPTKQMLEQEAKIKSKYHLGGDMSKHLAPNGKPSNLTHEQWHLVREPEFIEFFGDWINSPEKASKVVDENGEPLVVYHGTPNDFEKNKNEVVFDINKNGVHFGTEEQANDFFPFKIYECFLNIRNIQLGIDEEILVNQIIDDLQSEYGTDFLSVRMMKEVEQLTPSYSEQLQSGFDGLKYLNIMEGDQKSFSYVVFKPNQIKLADGTNTTFDAENPDIRFEDGGSIKPDFSNMSQSEIKAFYDTPEGRKLDKETYAEWKSLVNMSKSEITNFYNSPEGKQAGLSESEANEQGIDSGRESARWLMKMKDIPYKLWSSDMWRWAKKQISFIKRMSGMKGELYDDKGRKTRKHTALLIWGNNPTKKFEGGGYVPKDAFEKSENERNEDYEGNWNLWIDTLLKNIDLPIEWTTSESRKELYGDSFYITIFNEDWQEFAKLRFSGHSVTNTSRLQNEFHNPNISRFYEIVSRAMNLKQQEKYPENSIKFEGGGSIENEEMEETVIEHFKPYKSVEELAELHRVPISEIVNQLHIGEKVEMEHTTDYEIARIIALQHIEESKKYYTLLEDMEEKFEKGGEFRMATGGEIVFKPITTPL